MIPGDVRPCTRCNAPLTWDGDRNVWSGEHKEACPLNKNLRPSTPVPELNEVGVEDVIGGGSKVWEVTASTGRSIGGVWITDTFRVKADTYDGALLLAREVRPYIRDADAIEVK